VRVHLHRQKLEFVYQGHRVNVKVTAIKMIKHGWCSIWLKGNRVWIGQQKINPQIKLFSLLGAKLPNREFRDVSQKTREHFFGESSSLRH